MNSFHLYQLCLDLLKQHLWQYWIWPLWNQQEILFLCGSPFATAACIKPCNGISVWSPAAPLSTTCLPVSSRLLGLFLFLLTCSDEVTNMFLLCPPVWGGQQKHCSSVNQFWRGYWYCALLPTTSLVWLRACIFFVHIHLKCFNFKPPAGKQTV